MSGWGENDNSWGEWNNQSGDYDRDGGHDDRRKFSNNGHGGNRDRGYGGRGGGEHGFGGGGFNGGGQDQDLSNRPTMELIVPVTTYINYNIVEVSSIRVCEFDPTHYIHMDENGDDRYKDHVKKTHYARNEKGYQGWLGRKAREKERETRIKEQAAINQQKREEREREQGLTRRY